MTAAGNRLIRLLDRGFYPVELPPTFGTRRYSDVRASLAPQLHYVGATSFFDGATFRGSLRKFGVINPVNYLLLSQFISDEWPQFTKVYALSRSSGTRPKFPSVGKLGRSIDATSLANKRKSQAHLASAFPVVLTLDINRFYGSIYTHSIPWAALGKEQAKAMFANGQLNGHWSDRLDVFTRNCNLKQTVGIPIGPDTSRIISELLLSRIDAELTAKGSKISSTQIYHNIDDYQFGCKAVSQAEEGQSRFAKAIARYELRLNDFKNFN